VHLEYLLKALHMGLGFVKVRQEPLLQLAVSRLFRHFRKRLHELLFRIVDVLQLMHEQIVHGFDVSGEQSHCLLPFSLDKTRSNTTGSLLRRAGRVVSG
jgi:hypothetical protein